LAHFEDEFGERGLVEHDDVVARGTLLVQHQRQPSRRVQRVRRGLAARRQEIVGALPVELAAEYGALGLQPVVQR
jgi:hypothetical protein